MSDTKLKGALPKDDEANGLAGQTWSNRLVGDPEQEYVAIVTFKTSEIKTVPASHSQTPSVIATRFEPVMDEAEAEVLRQKLVDFAAKRRGLVQLPIADAPVNDSALDLDAKVTSIAPKGNGGDAA